MGYALFSLCFAGVNDLIFKGYGRKPRPVGLLLASIGAVWTLFFMAMAACQGGSHAFDSATLLSGTLAGILSASANILLIEGMKRSSAAAGATIYRLNLVFAAILAYALLGESMGPLKLAGLAAATAAVAAFAWGAGGAGGRLAAKILLVLIAASFLRACMGISYKFAKIWGADDALFLAVNGAWWMFAGLAYTASFERGRGVCLSILGYGLVCGTLLSGVVLFLKLAVNAMDASVAVSVSQFSFLVTAPLSTLFLGERLTILKGFGLALAALCLALFYMESR